MEVGGLIAGACLMQASRLLWLIELCWLALIFSSVTSCCRRMIAIVIVVGEPPFDFKRS